MEPTPKPLDNADIMAGAVAEPVAQDSPIPQIVLPDSADPAAPSPDPALVRALIASALAGLSPIN